MPSHKGRLHLCEAHKAERPLSWIHKAVWRPSIYNILGNAITSNRRDITYSTTLALNPEAGKVK
jgi:hypothetical protein